MSLTYSEQILLLALDEQTGSLQVLPELAMRYAIAGAVLLELAMASRIDTDLDYLHLISAEPTGDPLLDEVLRRMGEGGAERSTSVWLSALAWHEPDLQQQVLQRLVDKGVLRIEDRRILWVFPARQYRMLDGQAVQGVRQRLRALIDGDELPDPEEAVLIALVDAFHLFDTLFTPEDLIRLRPRIKALARLDLIGREVARTIGQIARAVLNQ